MAREQKRNGNVLAHHLNLAMAFSIEVEVLNLSGSVIASGQVTRKRVDAIQGLLYDVGSGVVAIGQVGKIRRAASG